MHFIMGDYLGFGMIGVTFIGMGNMLLAYAVFFGIVFFSVIGLFSFLKFLFTRPKRRKMSEYEKWERDNQRK